MSKFEELGITIGDLAERTGVTVATLRAWESRYGFPSPRRRAASGHRRYTREDADLVSRVVRLRSGGISLEAAITEARARVSGRNAPRSLFAELRRAHPELSVQVLSRRAMLALSTAIEDECCATAAEPLLVGYFQQALFYRRRQPRWRELARTASAAVVFADFPAGNAPAGSPVEVALPETTPLRREWAVVCQAPDATACLVGWERPGEGAAPHRRFEAVWSVAPDVVATAARAALAQAAELDCPVPSAEVDRPVPPVDPYAALARATAVASRAVAYLDR